MSIKDISVIADGPDTSAQSDSVGAEFRRGIKEGLPVLLGVIPFALVLGAQASHKGLRKVRTSS